MLTPPYQEIEALLKEVVGGKKLSGTKITKLQEIVMKSLKVCNLERPAVVWDRVFDLHFSMIPSLSLCFIEHTNHSQTLRKYLAYTYLMPLLGLPGIKQISILYP